MWFSPIFGQVQGSFKGSFFIEKTSIHVYAPGFLAGVALGGGRIWLCFPFPNSSVCKVRPLKFWTGRTLGKDKYIDNGVTVIVTSSLLC